MRQASQLWKVKADERLNKGRRNKDKVAAAKAASIKKVLRRANSAWWLVSREAGGSDGLGGSGLGLGHQKWAELYVEQELSANANL